MTLPLLLSVPHAGLDMPPELAPYARVAAADVRRDSDEGAREIYALAEHVAAFVTTEIARAFVDLNRAEDDRRADGVVKRETCFEVPIYRRLPPEEVVERLLERYHRPYHAELRRRARGGGVRLGVDGHTMLAEGPPIGPGAGEPRPLVCLANAGGTCPDAWMTTLADCFAAAFGRGDVRINDPFRGGYVIRSHAAELPWVMVEISRTSEISDAEKHRAVLAALETFCARTWPAHAPPDLL